MATAVTMPKLGIVMIEGTVSKWLKEPGQQVQKGEPVIEIATDKITYEMESPESGLFHPQVEIGVTVPVDGTLAYILAPDEAPPAMGDGARPAAVVASRVAPLPEREAVPLAEPPPAAPVPSPAVQPAAGRVRASPVARRAAREHGLDLALVQGTGPGGRIVHADVQRALAQRAAAPTHPPAPAAAGLPAVRERIPIGGLRRVIAQRMMESLASTAQVTLSTQADASHLVRIREQISRLEQGADHPRVPYDAILAKIVARALQGFPVLNSAVEGDDICILDAVNIAVAVSLEDGLVAPVLFDVDRKSLQQVSQDLVAVVERARSHTLTLDDLTGGTFGISNLGVYGVEAFTPILIPPMSGILGVGSIAERPVVEDGQLQVRETMHLSLTFDHRVTDGVPAGSFLRRVRELIENPWMLFW